MRVENWFDDEETVRRNRNKLKVSSTNGYPNCVEIMIIDIDNEDICDSIIVDSRELMQAVQNAMNN